MLTYDPRNFREIRGLTMSFGALICRGSTYCGSLVGYIEQAIVMNIKTMQSEYIACAR